MEDKMNYITAINEAITLGGLKAIGAKMVEARVSKERKTELVKAYRAKRRELERTFVDASKNTVFKQCLYQINNMVKEDIAHVAKVGKTIYDLVRKTDSLNRLEADILFRAYRYQKNKAGISFDKPTTA
jgi:hypothetical protein